MLSRNLLCKFLFDATIYFNKNSDIVLSASMVQLNRFKSKTSNAHKSSESSNSESATDILVDDKASRIMKINVTNPRVDLILKSGLGIARNKIEKLFYENKIRVNGQKIEKKSIQVDKGDEIDVIKGPSPSNPELLLVARVEVLSVKPGEDSLAVKIRRCKSLLIENYDKH